MAGLSSAVGHKNQCPPSEDNGLSICEDIVHFSYPAVLQLFTGSFCLQIGAEIRVFGCCENILLVKKWGMF
jgi:hypothetical protein